MRDCPRGNEAWAHHCLLQCQALGECAPSSEGGESGTFLMHQFWDEIFLNQNTQKWRVHQFWSELLAWEVVENHAKKKGHLSLWYPYLDEAINFRNRQMSLLVGHFDRRLPTWSTACVDFRCSISVTCRYWLVGRWWDHWAPRQNPNATLASALKRRTRTTKRNKWYQVVNNC